MGAQRTFFASLHRAHNSRMAAAAAPAEELGRSGFWPSANQLLCTRARAHIVGELHYRHAHARRTTHTAPRNKQHVCEQPTNTRRYFAARCWYTHVGRAGGGGGDCTFRIVCERCACPGGVLGSNGAARSKRTRTKNDVVRALLAKRREKSAGFFEHTTTALRAHTLVRTHVCIAAAAAAAFTRLFICVRVCVCVCINQGRSRLRNAAPTPRRCEQFRLIESSVLAQTAGGSRSDSMQITLKTNTQRARCWLQLAQCVCVQCSTVDRKRIPGVLYNEHCIHDDDDASCVLCLHAALRWQRVQLCTCYV